MWIVPGLVVDLVTKTRGINDGEGDPGALLVKLELCAASQHCFHEILMLLMLLAPYTHLMTKTGMGSAAGYQGLTARSQRSDKFGAAVRTLLVRRPVFLLTHLATVHGFFAAATALELRWTHFTRATTGPRALSQHMRLHFRVVVCPVPDVRRHPQVLGEP